MNTDKIYEDIALRTAGDIYIGVVGPVRTGKSTFIKRFMETQVIPNIDNMYRRERAKDELPQSGSGRMIMTTEPKFVPEEAAEIKLDGGESCSVRLIDCVGYLVDGALGQMEEEQPRLVTTPWFDHEIPMTEAAEVGTRKVIEEHSTIGIVITTDGSITDIPRESYEPAEERVISELQTIGKPFLMLLNSVHPDSSECKALAAQLQEKYGISCLCMNCQTLNDTDIEMILRSVLYEFPMQEMEIFLPPWIDALEFSHPIRKELFQTIKNGAKNMRKIRDAKDAALRLSDSDRIKDVKIRGISLGDGKMSADIDLPRELFYQTLSERSGFEVTNDGNLLTLLTRLAEIEREYDKVKDALQDVRETGYGIVSPRIEELKLEEPEIVKQGGRYGVRLKASAPSIHILCIKQKVLRLRTSRCA